MPSIRYRLLNVFAETPFGGNPLAVVEDGHGLCDEDMQRVARQFNLSETTFLLPSDRAAARIRIFTPQYEMPFAGHPTLGSADVVRTLCGAGDRFELEMQAGLIPVAFEDGRWSLAAQPAKSRPLPASREDLAAMLGLPVEALAGPAVWMDCGTEQALIPLRSPADVHACCPDAARIARHCVNKNGQAKAYVFARTAEGFEVRYWWLSGPGSLSEDPGTGSACANLGGWWIATHGDTPLAAIVAQGTAMGRPNRLTLNVNQGQVRIGGRVIDMGSGELRW
ncbi:MAG TPA: PhzF family phenazine biosynthesis protein [Vicinamibacterales bacterium]|nr:PhzF family phenazine biosynthesis protein [Vicinamibacterales bacterium]